MKGTAPVYPICTPVYSKNTDFTGKIVRKMNDVVEINPR
jgi:hypothetical protein